MQIKLSLSPSHRILTPGQPVPALTLWKPLERQFLSHWYNPNPKKTNKQTKKKKKRKSNPESAALEADALTTWPTRQYLVYGHAELHLL